MVSKFYIYGIILLCIGMPCVGCGDVTIHKTNLTREEAVDLVAFPLPTSATNIFYYVNVRGIQGLRRFSRFDVFHSEISSAVESIITHNNTQLKRNLAYERKDLPAGSYPAYVVTEANLFWWNPDRITQGYYRGEEKGYAVQLWIDEKVRFRFTEDCLKKLKDRGMPENVLECLKELREQEFTEKDKLLEVIGNYIGKEAAILHQELIMECVGEGYGLIYLYQTD